MVVIDSRKREENTAQIKAQNCLAWTSAGDYSRAFVRVGPCPFLKKSFIGQRDLLSRERFFFPRFWVFLVT